MGYLYSCVRNIRTEAPFGEQPYLWQSADIEETPGKRKSNNGSGNPASAANGSKNPPMQASFK